MPRISLSFCLLLLPLPVLAMESGTTPYTHPYSSYQNWSEPTVRDWRETHRLLADEPFGHAGHGDMRKPETESPPADQGETPSRPRAMPGMDHKGKEMPPADPHEGMQHGGEHP